MDVANSDTVSGARRASKTFTLLMRRTFAILGGVANLLGVYAFGEDHGWWRLPITISHELARELWMLAVGVGGPWMMILGSWIAAKAALAVRHDTIFTMRLIRPMFNIGSFFAIYHCAQVSFGFIIFPKYLNPQGFAIVSGLYLAIGLAFGLTTAMLENSAARRRPTSQA
jgi:hypothetical protein